MGTRTGKRAARRFGTLAEARTGLMRAILLFGSIAAALILTVVPDSLRHARDDAAPAVLDQTATGSIGPVASAAERTRAVRLDFGPCLMFPDGTQRGACR